MTGAEEVRYAVSDGIATVTLDAPERRNALTVSMALELVQALDRADADPGIGAIVIAGGASFCAGADRGVLKAAGADPATDDNYRALETIYHAFVRVGTTRVPTICAVRGHAVGAGLNLVLASDLRVISRDAILRSGFAALGVHPGGGHFVLLSRLVGREAAAGMTLFGDDINGARAAELGMAWQAVDDALVEARAREYALRVAADPEWSRRIVASFRAEVGPPALPWAVGVELERGPQMWSFRRGQL